MAVTLPAPSTVTTEVFELLHVPPASPLLLYAAVALIHKGVVPEIVPAVAFGLTTSVALEELPQTE